MNDWKTRPTLIEDWNGSVDYVMAIDENGTTDLNGIRKLFNGNILDLMRASYSSTQFVNERWFTITGVIMLRDNFPNFRDSINSIKYHYWKDGIYKYKQGERRVVFHSREIRKKEGPFNPRLIDYSSFIQDISWLINNQDFSILSASIDKIKHVSNYSNPYHVYSLCLNFIIERFCIQLNNLKSDGILLLESRGKDADSKVLKHLVQLLEYGNNYYGHDHFRRIKGVYFNPKWCFGKNNGKASYILLELADLISYPIFKYVKFEKMDQAFKALEPRLTNYPNYLGYGIKVFPK